MSYDDEYPSETTLDTITKWDPGPRWSGKDPWFDILYLVREAWNHGCGKATWEGQVLTLVTGGWSGNEDILAALSDNLSAWSMLWLASYRGGKHQFGIKDDWGDDKVNGPGTVPCRFHFLLDELEQRFPTPLDIQVRSDTLPEQYYLSEIDKLRRK